MDENAENKADHVIQKSDCQECGQFPYEFQCVECNGKYCSECINKDQIKNVHCCFNWEDNVDFRMMLLGLAKLRRILYDWNGPPMDCIVPVYSRGFGAGT